MCIRDSLKFVGRIWGYPLRVLGGLFIICHNFVGIHLAVFITLVSIFCPFGWEMPTHALPPNWGFWATLPPKWIAVSTQPPKGTSLRGNMSYNVQIVKISPLVRETKKKTKTRTVANWVFAQTTHVVASRYTVMHGGWPLGCSS